jgi:hypothetical protein
MTLSHVYIYLEIQGSMDRWNVLMVPMNFPALEEQVVKTAAVLRPRQ